MRVTTNEGRQLAGRAGEIVAQLHAGARLAEPSDADYMMAVARRARLAHGATVRTESAADFLYDLAALGLLTIDQADDDN